MHVENFKCFKDFDIELGKFNVLVGPNDSGKTALLQAIQIVGSMPPKESTSSSVLSEGLGVVLGSECIWRQQDAEIQITANAEPKRGGGQIFEVTSKNGVRFQSDVVGQPHDSQHLPPNWKLEMFSKCIGKASYYRFNPSELKHPSPVKAAMKDTGLGFPSFLDVIQSKMGWSVFGQLETEFCRRFPYYKGIGRDIIEVTYSDFGSNTFEKKDSFVLGFKTTHGKTLPANAVSDGVMLSLVFLSLNYAPDPPKILLIEEPENGVHHASLKEIVSTLKDLSDKKDVQVILTTHSPYLLDLVEPEDVRVFQKDEKTGAVNAVRLSDYPEVEDLKEHFMTGEIWTTFKESEIVTKVRGGQG